MKRNYFWLILPWALFLVIAAGGIESYNLVVDAPERHSGA